MFSVHKSVKLKSICFLLILRTIILIDSDYSFCIYANGKTFVFNIERHSMKGVSSILMSELSYIFIPQSLVTYVPYIDCLFLFMFQSI